MKNRFRKGLIGLLVGIGSILGFADTSKATPGRLDIYNSMNYVPQYLTVSHDSRASEGWDKYDSPYSLLMFVDPITPKIISKVQNNQWKELDVDCRPEVSMSSIYLELRAVANGAKQGDIISVDSPNWLMLDLPFAQSYGGWDFGNKTITLQEYNSSDPNNTCPPYDVRKGIYYGTDMGGGYKEFILPLPYLGTVPSDTTYAYFRLDFDRKLADFDNDGTVDLKDFTFLASEWGKTGNSLADIAISDPANAIYLSPNTTPYFDGVVDLADLVKFSESWLVRYRPQPPVNGGNPPEVP
jgi:hypothetical protein